MCEFNHNNDFECNLIQTTLLRRARKPHRCYECDREISPGERYRLDSVLDTDHTWATFKTCRHCAVAMDWLAAECGGYLFGSVRLDIESHLDDRFADHGQLAGLCNLQSGMRSGWQAGHGGLQPVPPMPPLTLAFRATG